MKRKQKKSIQSLRQTWLHPKNLKKNLSMRQKNCSKSRHQLKLRLRRCILNN